MRTLSQLATLAILAAIAVEYARADVSLFDSQGKAVAFVDSGGRVLDFNGHTLGVIKAAGGGNSAYFDTGGKQLGWFHAGALFNMEGKVSLAVSSRFAFDTEVPPATPSQREAPLGIVTEHPTAARPVFTTEWATTTKPHTPVAYSSPSVYAEFKPGAAGLGLAAHGVRAIAGGPQGIPAEDPELVSLRQRVAASRAELEAQQRLEAEATQRLEAVRHQVPESSAAFGASRGPRSPVVLAMIERFSLGGGLSYLIAKENAPEVGLLAGDALAVVGVNPNGLARVTRYVRESLDAEIAELLRATSKGGSPWGASGEEAWEVLCVALDAGHVARVTQQQWEASVGDHASVVKRCLDAVDRVKASRGRLRASKPLPEIGAEPGDAVRYLSTSGAGVELFVGANMRSAVVPILQLCEIVESGGLRAESAN